MKWMQLVYCLTTRMMKSKLIFLMFFIFDHFCDKIACDNEIPLCFACSRRLLALAYQALITPIYCAISVLHVVYTAILQYFTLEL
jgi:hypothetical protein